MRALLVLLIVTLGFGSTLPYVARLVRGADAHVCHCAVHGHGTCECPICNGGQQADDELAARSPSLRGTCGDEDPFFGARGQVATVGASAKVAVSPAPRGPSRLVHTAPRAAPSPSSAPATPPPRSLA